MNTSNELTHSFLTRNHAVASDYESMFYTRFVYLSPYLSMVAWIKINENVVIHNINAAFYASQLIINDIYIAS